MKKILFLSFLIFITKISLSQDTIFKNNGDKIRAKVMEINTEEIKYKRFDFPDGPLYIENKAAVTMIKYANGNKDYFVKTEQPERTTRFAGTVNYAPPENSKIEILGGRYMYKANALNFYEVQDVLMKTKDKKIMGLSTLAKKQNNARFLPFGSIPSGIIGLLLFNVAEQKRSVYSGYSYSTAYVLSSAERTKYLTIAALCGVVAIACPITAGVLKHSSRLKTNEAVRLYNEKY